VLGLGLVEDFLAEREAMFASESHWGDWCGLRRGGKGAGGYIADYYVDWDRWGGWRRRFKRRTGGPRDYLTLLLGDSSDVLF